ncbi:MAG: FeS-binding protein [Chloroflexi bacterium RBG_13_54_8]|nr:MAG: FeS-binding protein [Chloroflexi bacterium RBG_13_54_8]
MAKRRVMFTFPPERIDQPIIHNLGQRFKVVTNIRRADVSESRGWVVLELEGADEDIERGIAWVVANGIRVDLASGDIVEG